MVTLSLVLAAAVSPSVAGEPARTPDLRVHVPVAAVLVAGWLTSEVALKHQLAPPACRWCEVNAFDLSVRRVFNPALTPSSYGVHGPDLWSNVVGFALLPAAALGLGALAAASSTEAWLEPWAVDLVFLFEASFGALMLNQVVKFSVARARPYAVGASPELLATARDVDDHNLSFFSGHSTFTFALATAAGTLATRRGWRWAWVTWAVGGAMACTTAALRLAADKHWATDVLLGALVGSASGVLVPLLLRGSVGPAQVAASVGPQGVSLAGVF